MNKNIKILLVDASPYLGLPTLGLGYLASALRRAGYYNVKILQKRFYDDLGAEIIKENPGIIGYTSVSPNLSKTIDLAEKIKLKLKVPQILGGSHITALPQSLPDVFDLGVVGEAEETIVELMDLWVKTSEFNKNDLAEIAGLVYKQDGQIKITTPRSVNGKLDEIAPPARDLLNIKGFFEDINKKFPTKLYRSSSILTSRGCPYNCVFCQERTLMKRFRSHSAQRTVSEIEELVEKYNVNLIDIMDDLFIANRERFKEIVNLIIKKGLHKKTTFFCYCRADYLDDEACILLKKMNTQLVFIGFESGSERILSYLKNNTTKVETNQKAYDVCRRHGLNVYGSFIFGSPDETLEEMRMTRDFIAKNHMTATEVQVLTPLPGAQIWQDALNRGLVSNDMDWNKLYLRKGDNNVWLNEKMSFEEFQKFHDEEIRPLVWHHTQVIHGFEFKDLFQIKLWRAIFKKPKYYGSKIKHTVIYSFNNLFK